MKHIGKHLAVLAAAMIFLSSFALAAAINVRPGESIQAAEMGQMPVTPFPFRAEFIERA